MPVRVSGVACALAWSEAGQEPLSALYIALLHVSMIAMSWSLPR
jgi:hypothetical protein